MDKAQLREIKHNIGNTKRRRVAKVQLKETKHNTRRTNKRRRENKRGGRKKTKT